MDSDKSAHVEREFYYLKLERSNESSAEDGDSLCCETSEGREAIRKYLFSKIAVIFAFKPLRMYGRAIKKY